jgi:hypothetical protein
MRQPPRVVYKGSPKKHSWCRWAVFRVKRRNNSVNLRFIGDPGLGKSWSGIAFAEICAKMMGKTFTEKNIYFSIKDVIDEVAANEPPPGTIFFIDEQQISASAKNHQSKMAEAYAIFYSTVRSNRYIIITTLPFSDMELKKLRRFYHLEIECHGANISTNTVRTTPRFMQYSKTKSDKVYRKMLIVIFKDEESGIIKSRKLSYWDIPKPSDRIVSIYEGMKSEFKRKLYKRISKELAKEAGDDDGDTPKAVAADNVLQSLTDYQREIYQLMSEGVKVQKMMNEKLIEKGFNSTKEKVSMNIKWMRKKGVIIMK